MTNNTQQNNVVPSDTAVMVEKPISVDELKATIDGLSTKLQATTDLTDDLISASGNLVSHADTAISISSQAMAHADAVLTNYFAVFSIFVTVAIAIAGWLISKSNEEHIKKASDKIANDLMNNDEFVSRFAREMLKSDGLMNNLNTVIESLVKEQADKSNNVIKEKLHDLADNLK
ncbi:MAG: hypothetical protein PHN45_12920 [Methylococcales bacterium]|nr:hypothetical protein [Methylococcales bacterium]MDD5755637.1 hypothetical protein [Methylococcales bacterium]